MSKFSAPEIKQCSVNDEKCLIENFNVVFSKYYKGLEEFGIPVIDPMEVGDISIGSDGDGPVSLKATFTKSSLTGLKNLQMKEVKGFVKDFDGKELSIKAVIPEAKTTGEVKVKGRLMILPLDASGKSGITFSDLTVGLKCKAKSVKTDGNEHLQFDTCHMTFDPKK